MDEIWNIKSCALTWSQDILKRGLPFKSFFFYLASTWQAFAEKLEY